MADERQINDAMYAALVAFTGDTLNDRTAS